MKKILLLTLGILLCAGGASAQLPGGLIAVYWDLGGTQCYTTFGAAGLGKTYFFHEGIAASNASQFKVEAGPSIDPGTQYVGYSATPYLNILSQPAGDPPDNTPLGGVSIAYGNPQCEPLPAKIMEITWFFTSFEPLDCSTYVRVVADPLAAIAGIETRDCTNNPVEAAGGQAYVAQDNTCGPCDTNVPTELETWGQIKALYQ